ncbi:hypothetical protein DB32_000983 [Sandaracinus amylolyticus]|uniref:Uncharacterized protein n=1 Tax=Sandaracinus amylolyticus TaxID=927083 RepID=A0A0F6SDQ1_9BACT|nr:hypothetical protein DB32_000983 [Sandaracinus amylolyticus]
MRELGRVTSAAARTLASFDTEGDRLRDGDLQRAPSCVRGVVNVICERVGERTNGVDARIPPGGSSMGAPSSFVTSDRSDRYDGVRDHDHHP